MTGAGAARGCALGAIALTMGALVLGCEGRPRRGPAAESGRRGGVDAEVVELDLSRGVPESTASSLFGPSRRGTLVELVRSLGSIAGSDDVKAVVVRLGGASVGLARAHEVGRLLGAIRETSRSVHCHADDLNNATLLLTSLGCTRVWLSPAGGVNAVGIAAQLLFGERLLKKLHVEADFVQVGKYKGASEPYTRDRLSPEARESLEGALRAMRAAWLDGITKGRSAEAAAAAEDGPYSPEEAKAKGLIDAIGYLDDARDAARKDGGASEIAVRFGAASETPPVSRGIVDILRAVSGSGRTGVPHVAVLPATGAITMASAGVFGKSDGITERELGPILGKLAKDESVKAVVLRLDSPGGSALASDLLWKRLMKLRAVKPVIVSVGGMAASGGYYLACAGTKVLAEPTSIIGSIGVVSGRIGVGAALDELGVTVEVVGANPDPAKANRAAWMSPLTPWDDVTRARLLASATSIYEVFLKRISEGRGLPVEAIAPSAEGRIFAGTEAKERKLVDQIGGLGDALALALSLGGLPSDAPVEVVGGTSGLLDLFDGADEEDSAGEGAALAVARRTALEMLAPEWVAQAPEVGTFLAGHAPLAQGEKTLAVLPFVVMTR